MCGSPSIDKNVDVALRFLEDLSVLAVPHLKAVILNLCIYKERLLYI
jgi:hypothetical protein